MSEFDPELGQSIFGQPYQEMGATDEVVAAMRLIAGSIEGAGLGENPGDNNGSTFINGTFQMDAYSWSEEEQPFNFKWKNFQVSWYKYLARSATQNRAISPRELAEMTCQCLGSIFIGVRK